MIFFKVHLKGTNISVFTTAFNREEAKQNAHRWIQMGNPDEYEVTPLTSPGDRFKIETFHV